MLRLEGYEPSLPIVLNRGDGLDASLFLSRLDDVVELKPSDPSKRLLRLHVNNRLLPGGCRAVQVYAPYWLVNNTGLPLMFREVRLGINTSMGAATHAMDGQRRGQADGGGGKNVKLDPMGDNDDDATEAASTGGDSSHISEEGSSPTPLYGGVLRDESETYISPNASERVSEQPSQASERSNEDKSRLGSEASAADADREVVEAVLPEVALEAAERPILFAYSKHDLFINRLSMRVAKTPGGWSKLFSTEVLNMHGALRVGPYEVGISVASAPAPADFTKVVTFAPRYVLHNGLSYDINARQAGQHERVIRVEAGEELPFHWPLYKGDHLLQLAICDQMAYRSPFSGGFRIDEVGEITLRCGDPEQVRSRSSSLAMVCAMPCAKSIAGRCDRNASPMISHALGRSRARRQWPTSPRDAHTLTPTRILPRAW